MRSVITGAFRAALAAGALAVSTAAPAVYVFNTIDYPGATFTDVRGLNNAGRIAGYASLDGINFFGFTYAGGVFAPLPPSAVPVSALNLNDAGTIVGNTSDDPNPDRAFILNGTIYSFFTRPGYVDTYARAISTSGLVTGYSADAAGATAGFIYNPFTGLFTDISPAGSTFTIAQGINAAGQVVGSANLPALGGQHGWLREIDGTITTFRIAGSPTRARGINDTGLITGFVTVGGTTSGFVGNSTGYDLLHVPGSGSTFGESINNAGQVSGLYMDSTGAITRGFIATPVHMPTGTTSSGAYTFSVSVVPNVPIFIDPVVAVGYDYAIGKKNPRIATVRLPIGIGDSIYRLKVDGKKFTVAGGDLFDFREAGFRKGVEKFRVDCIEVSALLDPANPQAFPTELTFMDAGMFTGTQKPLTRDSDKGDAKKCLARDDDDDEDDDDKSGKGRGKGKD
ncbi:MAG TPA: hypothetical protein PLD37_00090 [Usitatibacteraceae bacterium]|jgi:hypothetical protein|nr:hypothetical protein [Usitatibacteraceae bacterium]